MTTFIGVPIPADTVLVPTDTIYRQVFCTLSELDDDLNLLGSEREGLAMSKILAASDILQKQIGWFLPVTLTRKFNGHHNQRLYVPPLLSISSIVNNTTTLDENDYIAQPEARYWANGPYAWLDVDIPDASHLAAWYGLDQGVQITGKWGLYDLQTALPITVAASQSDAALTLRVTDGSRVSPGMVLVIGSEQEYVVSTATPTSSVTTLSAAIADADVQTISLVDASLINIGEIIRVGLEQMKVLDISGNTVAVIRGWNRSAKIAHVISSNVDVYRTFNVTRGVNGTTAASHSSGSEIARQEVPADINALCRKIASRMLKDAHGGFSGVIGDSATGQAMYLYIMPKELADIKATYRIIRVVNA